MKASDKCDIKYSRMVPERVLTYDFSYWGSDSKKRIVPILKKKVYFYPETTINNCDFCINLNYLHIYS